MSLTDTLTTHPALLGDLIARLNWHNTGAGAVAIPWSDYEKEAIHALILSWAHRVEAALVLDQLKTRHDRDTDTQTPKDGPLDVLALDRPVNRKFEE